MSNLILGFIFDRLEEAGIPFVQSVQTTYVPFSLQAQPDKHIFVYNDQKPTASFSFYEDRLIYSCHNTGDTLEQMFQIELIYEEYLYDMELIKREALLLLLSFWV